MDSDRDFLSWGPYLFAALLVLIIGGFLRLLFPQSALLETVYACCGALLFSLYIIFDTHLLVKHYGPEDYVQAALSLYLDIVNLFINILAILRD